jgi:MarR family transcriptional regulator, temperature-dependent positive regulator of motility
MTDPAAPGTVVLLTRLSKMAYRVGSDAVLGIRMKEFTVLGYLREHGSVSQQTLGDAMYMDANNLVLLLNDLETPGFIRRTRDPEDRRRHIVEMTPGGRRALERAEKGLETVEDELLAGLTPAERITLRQLLERALQGVGRSREEEGVAGARERTRTFTT